MKASLDVSLRSELDSKFRDAILKAKAGESAAAVRLGEEAWNLFPDPKFGWDVSWSYTRALTKVYRDTAHFPEALAVLDSFFKSGEVLDHQDGPRFLLGTVYFEMGDLANAKKWLGEANRISKGRCSAKSRKNTKKLF